ncbi:TIGR01620 family protein [Celerinatantimonas yamalensis]|uniref:TIGR01620 family protein n=1 Tax=Celerinatantimonas yamalensis TaxID=559956 RepID=A0ABW9G3I9_9GAMM
MNVPPRQDYPDKESSSSSVDEPLGQRRDFSSENVDWQAYSEEMISPIVEPIISTGPSRLRWYWRVAFSSGLFILLWPLFTSLYSLIYEPLALNQLFAISVVVLSVVVLIAIGYEWWAVFCLSMRQKHSHDWLQHTNQYSVTKLRRQCAKMASSMHCSQTQWQQSIQNYHEPSEILSIFEQQVLSEQDKRAKALILKFSSQSAVMLALSPFASLDMALMMWRNLRLMRLLAKLYGLPSGLMMQMSLMKIILGNIAFAGASQVIADLGVEMTGTNLTRKLSASMADGLSAGLLTARLGYKCMQVCRPLTITSQQLPKLASIQRQLLKDLVVMTSKR